MVLTGLCSTNCYRTRSESRTRSVTKHANTKLDVCCRRVQNETMGHRGRKSDPLYRSRQLLTEADEPREVRTLGGTLIRWKQLTVNWQEARVSSGPTGAFNNLIKRVKREGFGFSNFVNYRIRSLLCARKLNWHILATITPH